MLLFLTNSKLNYSAVTDDKAHQGWLSDKGSDFDELGCWLFCGNGFKPRLGRPLLHSQFHIVLHMPIYKNYKVKLKYSLVIRFLDTDSKANTLYK